MTPGALRAGRSIHAVLKRHLPLLKDSNAQTLAQIIDGETAAPELLEACKGLLKEIRNHFPDIEKMRGETCSGLAAEFFCAEAAIAKAERGNTL